MNTLIMRVVKQGEAFAVQSQKSENGQMMEYGWSMAETIVEITKQMLI